MSPQADFIVSNGTGAAVRSDLNVQFAAIVSNNSGATEPATMYAYQWWADTTTGLLKLRNSANSAWITMRQLDGEFSTVPVENGSAAAPSIYFKDSGTDSGFFSPGTDAVAISTAGTNRLHITSGGLVGINTASPSQLLHVNDGVLRVEASGGASHYGANSGGAFITTESAIPLSFYTNQLERARIDSSGRLLVGTSSARTNIFNTVAAKLFQVESDGGTAGASLIRNSADGGSPDLVFGKSRSASVGGNTIVQSGDAVGSISFQGNDGSEFVAAASITAEIDGTPGANDMPGRLVFSTTADGASSATERMRIRSDGTTLIGKTAGDDTVVGVKLGANAGDNVFTVGSGASWALMCNRQGDDGTLILFRQANTSEGSISVSGTTVSYNGAHLSRWSQLPSGAERTEILRGSVLSNIDEMCEWGEEDNEQLNRMKVSDVEGDKNVSGVFQCWDDDDDTYTNDFYCAMTGDFIIRIGAGTTVERGDLLMSAGDGTAKPQDDDIIRSKTIAKVTSVNVSCTYEDGSYCVPCVLMAC
jgi:hypothetical protein